MIQTFTFCPRCGKEHKDLTQYKFTKYPFNQITHWAICPVNQEPILITMIRRTVSKYLTIDDINEELSLAS